MRLGQVVQSSCLTPCDVCPGTVSPAVRTCIGCELSYCKDCLERTHGNDGLGHCLVKPEENVDSEMPRCRQHGQLVELFCQTDGVPVCLECLQTGRHKGHNATSMEDWANREQERHEARAHRKRARQESGGIAAAEDTVETINDIESLHKVVKHPPNEQPRGSVHQPLTGQGQETVVYGDNYSQDAGRRNDIAATGIGTDVDFLSREGPNRPVGLKYAIRGDASVPHPSTIREAVRPVVRSVKDVVTTPEIASQHPPRERQPPVRGCLSTGQIRTQDRIGGNEVLRPSMHSGFNDREEDHFGKPQQQRIGKDSIGVSTHTSGPYYISCREEVVGPVVFNNVEPTPFGETVVAEPPRQQQSGEKQPNTRGYQNADLRVTSGDSHYRDQAIASSLLNNNINSSKNVNAGEENSQKHPRNEEQLFVTRYQGGLLQSFAGKESNLSSEKTQKTLERDGDHPAQTPGNLYLIDSPKLPTKDDLANIIATTRRRQQQDYRTRSREQANKNVQQAVQDMFTKYMVTGHGLATMEQQQPAPVHNTDTNGKGSPAIFRPALKFLGKSTETKATRIAHAMEIANKPAPEEGTQFQSTSKLGDRSGPVETATKEPSARPTPKPRGTTGTAVSQKYVLTVTVPDKDREAPQSQNNGSFENARPETEGVRPVETEAVGQYPSTPPGANHATSGVASGQQNRQDDSGEHLRPNTHSTGFTQRPAEQLDDPVNMGKVQEKPNVMGQGMKAGTFKARSLLRLSGRRSKSSSRDVPSHPKSVNMAMSVQDAPPTKAKRQDPRNGGMMPTDRRQPAKTNSAEDPSLAAVRVARVLPQRRETSDGSQLDITAQSSPLKIIPTLCGVGHTWITLRWTVSEVENYKAYQVQYQKHGGPVIVTPFRYGNTKETVENLSPGTTYTMQVRALDMEGLVHCSNIVEMKTSSRRLAVPAQAETAAKLRQAVQEARENRGQEAKSKKPSRWGLSHLTASFRRKKKKSATSESDTESKASYTDSPMGGRRVSDVRRSSIDSQESEISTVSTISRTSRKSQKRVHFKEEDIAKAYEIREMQALYPELSNVENVIGDDLALPESTKQVDQRDHRRNEEKEGKDESKLQQQADVDRRHRVSSPVFMTLMDQGEESEAETFRKVADNVRGTIGMAVRKVSVEVQTNEGGVFRPAIQTATARGSGGDSVLKPSDRSTEWETNVPLDTKGEGFRHVKRERTWQEIIEEDYDPKEGWKNVQVGDKMRFIDLEAIKPYRKVLTHAGYYGDKSNAIVVFSSCYMPNNSLKDYEYIMENLFLYILSFLDKVVDEEYKIVFLNYTKERSNLPSVTWLKSCYDHIDAKFKKKLKGLFIVHPTIWLKMLVHVTKPFVSSKFSKKLQFVDNFKDLQKQLPVDPEAIPEDVKKFEEELVGSSANKGGTFAALKAALGREVQTGSVPENAFCAPYNKGLASNMWEGFPTLRL
ncbi:Protein prune 2 [Branchiostoma belcheri]|nr:Protein prune 2 [Branchiostoma belcheri]